MRKWDGITALLVVLVAAGAAAHGQVRGFGLSELEEQAEKQNDAKTSFKWTIPSVIADMDIRTKVAQLQLVTLEGRVEPSAVDRRILETYTPGAVVIPNVVRPVQAVRYMERLRENPLRKRMGVPLMVGTDLAELPVALGFDKEGYFAPLPTMLALAAADDPNATRDLANVYAEHLAAMGFSFQMGPCLALAPTLPGSEGGLDCLGADPEFVGQTAEIFLQAATQHGLTAMFTGFPGGYWNRSGDAPAILHTPGAALKTRDLVPFRRAVMAGARMILVGPMMVPTIDTRQPAACLSSKVMKDILRDELLFPGIIAAGPLDALRVGEGETLGDAAIAAFNAGADVIYWRQSGIHILKATEAVVQAVERGDLPESTVDVSLTRLLQLKEDLELRTAELPKEREARRLEKRRAYPKIAHAIERRAVTVVKNQGDALPLVKGASTPVGVTGVIGVSELYEALKKELKYVAQQPIATAKHGNDIYDFEIYRLTSRAEGAKTIVIVLTNALREQGKVELIRKFRAMDVRVVAVLVGYPHTLPQLAEADAIVLTYCDPESATAAMQTVAETLVGKGALAVEPPDELMSVRIGEPVQLNAAEWVRSPAGRLPVTIEPPYVAGAAECLGAGPAVKKVLWEFGDGAKAKGATAQHSYNEPGAYAITLTVVDELGFENAAVAHVEVAQ